MDREKWIDLILLALVLVAAFCQGCTLRPTSCDIRIAPSAEIKAYEILSAVEWWNQTEGAEVCTVSSTDSELAIDGAVTVRLVPRPLVRDYAMAITRWEMEGPIVVTLGQRTTVQAMAHELGHCMGLEHAPNDPKNLMFPISSDDRWGLTESQKEEVR